MVSACREEMPVLQQVHDSWSSKGLVVIEVDIGEKPEIVRDFMAENNLNMTVALDMDGHVAGRIYLVGAIPTAFLIDKDGVIRQKIVGAFPNVAAIEKELGKIIP